MTKASILVKLNMAGAPHELDYVDAYGALVNRIEIFLGAHLVETIDQHALRSMIELDYGSLRYDYHYNQYMGDSAAAAAVANPRKRYMSTHGIYIPIISGFLKSGKCIPTALIGEQLRIVVHWDSITNAIVTVKTTGGPPVDAPTNEGAHTIASAAIECETIQLDAISEGKLRKYISKMGGLQIPFRAYQVLTTTSGSSTTVEHRFRVNHRYLNKVFFCLRSDSAITPNTSHAMSHLVNDGITNYSVSIGQQNMTGEIGGTYGYAHMYKNLLNCFPSPYPLAYETHHTSEHSLEAGSGAEDETIFHNFRFVMGANLESSMENKYPTLSGNQSLEKGGDLTLKFSRTGTTSYPIYALVEFTQILKINQIGQITLLN